MTHNRCYVTIEQQWHKWTADCSSTPNDSNSPPRQTNETFSQLYAGQGCCSCDSPLFVSCCNPTKISWGQSVDIFHRRNMFNCTFEIEAWAERRLKQNTVHFWIECQLIEELFQP